MSYCALPLWTVTQRSDGSEAPKFHVKLEFDGLTEAQYRELLRLHTPAPEPEPDYFASEPGKYKCIGCGAPLPGAPAIADSQYWRHCTDGPYCDQCIRPDTPATEHGVVKWDGKVWQEETK